VDFTPLQDYKVKKGFECFENRFLALGEPTETASTLIDDYIVRYFSFWLTPEIEKSFDSLTQAKQFACLGSYCMLRMLPHCGHKLLNFLFLKIIKNVSTRDPSSAIFLLKNYACAFTKAKKTGAVQSF